MNNPFIRVAALVGETKSGPTGQRYFHFSRVGDFAADLVSHCQGESQEWSEWRWTGTRQDGGILDMAGVIIVGVRDGRISWGRLYVEPVQATEETIDEAVQRMAGHDSE